MKKINVKGFTLIELLAVIVIIAIIATIGVFAVTKIMDKSRMDSLKSTALAVKKAAQLYIGSNEMLDDKILNMTPKTGADRALLDLAKDPWGNDYKQVLSQINKTNNGFNITVYLETTKGIYTLAESVNQSGAAIEGDFGEISDYPDEVKTALVLMSETFVIFNGVAESNLKIYDRNNYGPPTGWVVEVDNTQVDIVDDPLGQKGKVMQLVFEGCSGCDLPYPQGSNYWEPVFTTNTLANFTPGDQYQVSVDILDVATNGSFNLALYTDDYDRAGGTTWVDLVQNTWHREEATFTVPADGKNYLPGVGVNLSPGDATNRSLYFDKIIITKIN